MKLIKKVPGIFPENRLHGCSNSAPLILCCGCSVFSSGDSADSHKRGICLWYANAANAVLFINAKLIS